MTVNHPNLMKTSPIRYDVDDVDLNCDAHNNNNHTNDHDKINNLIYNNDWDILHTILKQENTYSKIDYYEKFMMQHNNNTDIIHMSSRAKMIQWFHEVIEFCYNNTSWNVTNNNIVDSFHNNKVIEIAISYMDRYIGSDNDIMFSSLTDTSIYQLTGMTCLYIATKLNQHKILDISFIIKLSNGQYNEKDITDMEYNIFHHLLWKCHPPTIYDYIHIILNTIKQYFDSNDIIKTRQASSTLCWIDIIYELVLTQVHATEDNYSYITMKPSMIAYCSIMNALHSIFSLSPNVQQHQCDDNTENALMNHDIFIINDMNYIMNIYLDHMVLLYTTIISTNNTTTNNRDTFYYHEQIRSLRKHLYESLVKEQQHQEQLEHELEIELEQQEQHLEKLVLVEEKQQNESLNNGSSCNNNNNNKHNENDKGLEIRSFILEQDQFNPCYFEHSPNAIV